MYAIIMTGGKQYRVQMGDELKVEKLDAEVGSTVTFTDVLAVGGDSLKVGNPYVEGFAVTAEVLEQGKNDKVIIYKYKAKKDYRRKNGHRQPYTLVKITGLGDAKAPAKKAEPKKAAVKAEAPKAKAEAKAETKVEANLSMKKDELLEIAKNMGIEVNSKATKADILAAIQAK